MKSIVTFFMSQMSLLIFSILVSSCSTKSENSTYDVVVYGATPAGIISAVTAAEHGANVLLLEPMSIIGGMYTSGLNTAESNHMINQAITGRARDFYIRLGEQFYDSAYFETFGQGRSLDFQPGDPAFFFESRHALIVFRQMLEEAGIEVLVNARLENVATQDTRINALTLTDGRNIEGKYFVDCSYEGDLMALAGVSYTFGREPVGEYNESLAGLRLIDDTLSARTIDEEGHLLPYFNAYDTLVPGSGDKKVMNFNFRPLMTEVDSIKKPIYRPENYDSTQFNILADFLEKNPDTHLWDLVGKYRRGGGKFEFNNQQKALVSLGMFGANEGYVDGDWETRDRIYREHKDWTLGFLYFLANDPRVPKQLREETQAVGFATNEFVDNNNFPYYLYVREGRRMKGAIVQNQHDVFRDRQKEDAVLLGSHWIDSHHVQRIALSDSTFTNEGRIWEMVLLPFEVSYRTMTPTHNECTNLLVPVCASFSHVAFCAYRLESTWMQAGHAAGLAISQALKKDLAVQDISIEELQRDLVSEGMVIEADSIYNYDDYDWLKENNRYKDRYKRMYEAYGMDLEGL